MKPTRPFQVTLLALLVLIITTMNIARLVQVLQHWVYISELINSTAIYLALSALVWAIVGLLISFGLWFRKVWAPGVTRTVALVYTFYYWIEYIFLVNRQGRQGNWPFLLGINLLLLIWFFWVFSRMNTMVYFGVGNER